jgi:hypothetical protein
MNKGAVEDRFVYAEIKKLIEEYKIDTIIETGTYFGWSAKKLSEFGLPVHTIEVNPDFLKKAREHTLGTKNVFHYYGSSPQVLDDLLGERDLGKILFFLDAHWGDYWPIHDELRVMKTYGLKPIILIHDFFVPDENGKAKFGYDVYKGQALDHEFMKPVVEDLFGKDEYVHYCIQNRHEVDAGVGIYYSKGGVK